jgi:phosphocarrier protein HPr
MAERTVAVGSGSGLHARPARLFVKAAAALSVPVTATVEGKRPARADSMLAVLALGAVQGTEVTLTAPDDPEGVAAVDQLAELLATDLDQLSDDAAAVMVAGDVAGDGTVAGETEAEVGDAASAAAGEG